MKIGVFSIPEINLGKHNIKDPQLDQVDKLVKAKKKTYVQVETVGEDSLLDADAILAMKDARTDLVLKDLEFIETRLGRCEEGPEKIVLNKLKGILEKEEFANAAGLTPEEKQLISGYGLLTLKPVVLVAKEELEDINTLLIKVLNEGGFTSFFTAGDKENRAWLIRKGTTAWEAAGAIHSDIQKGFIRAEIIGLDDFLSAGGENQAKQAGKQRLEQKDYVMQYGDLANFRFNK
jgi:ribosome-binding ATPase YchF (GTP1/OBG family)